MLKYLFVKPAGVSSDPGWLDVPQDAEVFTYHQKHAGQALLGGLILAAIVEAAGVHLLISMWNHWVALAFTLTSVWLVLQIIAQIRAMGMRPMYIDRGRLMVRNGAFDLADIAISKMVSIEKSMKEIKSEKGQLTPLNVGFPATHNVVLRLKEPMEAMILNRKKRNFQIALLAIDDADRLVETIRKQLSCVTETE